MCLNFVALFLVLMKILWIVSVRSENSIIDIYIYILKKSTSGETL